MMNLRKDLEGNGRHKIEILSRNLPERTKETHEKIRVADAQAAN
jgi:hypothetical protein